MRRIVIAFSGTVLAVILLFGYRTSTNGSTAGASIVAPAAGATGGSSAPATGPRSTPPATSGPSSSAGSGSSTSAKTYSGSAADTRWGTVQVQITVVNRKITSATTLQVPDGNGRDQEINSYAVPILDQEVVTAQSAQIDTVSGATVTSDGYLQSLQAAVTAAGL